jgi:hypothetical protein
LQSRNQAINEQLQQFGVQGGARTQGLNEALTQRGQASNELAAALGISPGVGFQQFQPTAQAAVNPTDVLGANALSQGVQQNIFNQQSATGRGILEGFFNVGAAKAGAPSDRRLKTNIRKIGALVNGLGVYAYNYIWGGPEQVGVMADEVRKVLPSAVFRVGEYDVVDYRQVLGAI